MGTKQFIEEQTSSLMPTKTFSAANEHECSIKSHSSKTNKDNERRKNAEQKKSVSNKINALSLDNKHLPVLVWSYFRRHWIIKEEPQFLCHSEVSSLISHGDSPEGLLLLGLTLVLQRRFCANKCGIEQEEGTLKKMESYWPLTTFHIRRILEIVFSTRIARRFTKKQKYIFSHAIWHIFLSGLTEKLAKWFSHIPHALIHRQDSGLVEVQQLRPRCHASLAANTATRAATTIST